MDYDIVIGLEVHAQLSTRTKLFCGCKVEFGAAPNTHICPICLGMPGVLPVPNIIAVGYAVKLGLATNCNINQKAMWTRKNYFYPDLPKGYQVTQQGGSAVYDHPICKGGYLELPAEGHKRKIGITRIHMEEDAGKLIHDLTPEDSLFDANRCGTPLVEVVSEPDIKTPHEARLYLEKMKQILEYLEICDADMENGNLRCDANISLRQSSQAPFGNRVEIKNMNSFSNLEKALESEIELQTMILDGGGSVNQVTKRWDPNAGKTIEMRSKEDADDYRYFPEPDLIRLEMVDDAFINKAQVDMPELPDTRRQRFFDSYELSEYDAAVLTAKKPVANYFEKVCAHTSNYKSAANWVMGNILGMLKDTDADINQIDIKPEHIASLINLVDDKKISGRIAKQVFSEMMETGLTPEIIVQRKGLSVVSNEDDLIPLISELIASNPSQAAEYKAGKHKLMGYFMGQIMKATKGKASPEVVTKILTEKLSA